MAVNQRIIVINPNSTEAVTRAMDRALDPLRIDGGPEIESVTNPDGPPGIESQRHADTVGLDICRMIQARDNDASAFVIACFSDPGIHAARETTAKPVMGIAESGILTALTLGPSFGVIAILPTSLARQQRYVRAMGVESRFAGNLPVGLKVVELADEDRTFGRLVATGERLRDEKGAGVLVLGCAGMAKYRERLSDATGLPVVDPCQAAVGMAISAVRLGNGSPSARAAA
jgi:allantoin racemase